MSTKKPIPDPNQVVIDTTVSAPVRQSMDDLVRFDRPGRVETAADYTYAIDWLKAAKEKIKRAEEWFAPLKKAATDAKNIILRREHELLDGPRIEVDKVARLVVDYRAREEEKRKQAEREAREKAQREAEEQRKAQLASLEAAAKATASRNEKRALRDQASALAEAPVVVTSVAPVASTVPKVAGVHERETWSADVFNPRALTIGAAIPLLLEDLNSMTGEEITARGLTAADLAGARKFLQGFDQCDPDCVMPNQTRLNAIATQCRDQVPVPGVIGVRKTSLVARA